MKLKAWLREQKGMSYSEYRALPEFERYSIYGDFLWDNRCLQKKAQAAQKRIQAGWRPMTEEERKQVDEIAAQEQKRYLINSKIGGLDERGNYTALHHRWEK